MQYHYVVVYDTDTDKWTVESEWETYFPDGSIYNTEMIENGGFPNGVYPGWFMPEEGSDQEALDAELWRTLYYIAPTWPTPSQVKA